MAYKRKYSSRRKTYRKTRGRFGAARRTARTFQTRVNRAVMKKTETKYLDVGGENVQLYHNTGIPGYAHVGPMIWNPWYTIANGNNRASRIGDKISPLGMKIRLWLSNKLDRPNVSYRIVACIMPRLYQGAVVGPGSVDPAPALTAGTLGNYAVLPWDKEKGIKVLYDKIVKITTPWGDATGNTQKECSKTHNLWIKRKSSRPIVYDNNGYVLNNYFSLYVIPYDAYGSLTTDNIASMAYFYRLYWKDP
nr:MAG: capsid protein [Cressdnaviricota sp.]